ncbi:MAG: GntR family transcriptional regulator [Lachnospiraceae bacterium]|nr:GntR family transcriptional regulator [Lachnospiraceae bacterium]
MPFSEIVAPTIKEMFTDKIEEMILSGELKIGEKLPSERELAAKMKVSKTIVHSGLSEMERKGFLRIESRVGIYVNDYAKYGTLETMESIAKHHGGMLDERNIRSLLELRYAIEGICLKEAAKNRTPEQLEYLRDLVKKAEEICLVHPEKTEELAECYFDFHHYICVISGNTIAPLIIYAFKKPSISFWANSIKALSPRKSLDRLMPFFTCIEKKDPEGALEHLRMITDTSDRIVV